MWQDAVTRAATQASAHFPDCQGAEIPILVGGLCLIERTEVIILELPFAGQYNEGVLSFVEHIDFMKEIGFIPFDISAVHRLPTNNVVHQADFVFVKNNSSMIKKFPTLLELILCYPFLKNYQAVKQKLSFFLISADQMEKKLKKCLSIRYFNI